MPCCAEPKPDGGGDLDDGGAVLLVAGVLNRRGDAVEVRVAVLDVLRVPAVRRVARQHVLRPRQIGLAINGDVVVVVEHNQLAEAKVTGERARLRADALLQAAVAAENVGVVVDDVIARLVEARGRVRLGDGNAHRVGDALAERAGADLDAGVVHLGVAGGLGVELSKVLQVVDGVAGLPDRYSSE